MPATSGNVYHYMQWAREVAGVGDSKIFPTMEWEKHCKNSYYK